jgi:uncharacterized YigZ family protein
MTPSGYSVPAQPAVVELRVVNSDFIAAVARADTVAEAKAFIQSVRELHPKANHHVYAFVIGHGASITEGSSDDGEPSGTAGRPVLAVLRGSGLGDTVVVVTRYFGGTKLGTGGLVRAYSDAARQALEETPRVVKIEKRPVTVAVPYGFYEPVKRLIAAYEGEIVTEDFSVEVTLRLRFAVDDVQLFVAALADGTAGRARIVP